MNTSAHPSDATTREELALSVECVGKTYRRLTLTGLRPVGSGANRIPALADVSFQVQRGEMIGLLGPNGAGKTTLLKIIATLLYPSQGRVLAYGRDIFTDSIKTRGSIGLVTCDERSFYWRLTGRHNLRFFATLYGLSRNRADQAIDELLDALGLTDAADRRYDGYSSGMKQKMAIARGLLSDPDLLLYDEPTRSLDPLSAYNIHQWILAKRTRSPHQTHVIATNKLTEAEQLCDRVLIINRGRLIAQGTIAEIRSRWNQRNHEVHRVSYQGRPLHTELKPSPESGLIQVEPERTERDVQTLRLRTRHESGGLSQVLEAILASGGRITQCVTEQPPFDEVFCSLVLGEESPADQPEPQPEEVEA